VEKHHPQTSRDKEFRNGDPNKRSHPSSAGDSSTQFPTNRSFYVNLPAALAEAVQLEKGEELEWFIEDKNTLILRRRKPAKLLKLKH
jgi:hypothetical protein